MRHPKLHGCSSQSSPIKMNQRTNQSSLVRQMRSGQVILSVALLSFVMQLGSASVPSVTSTDYRSTDQNKTISSIRLLLSRSNQRIASTTTTTTPKPAPKTSAATSLLQQTALEEPLPRSTTAASNLIESILVRVENLNLFHRKSTDSNSTETEEDAPTSPSSLKPEVRASTGATTVASKDAEHYSVANETREQHQTTTIEPEDLELDIESNRVSGSSTLSSYLQTPSEDDNEADSKTCEQAYTDCNWRRETCRPSLELFQDKCQADLENLISSNAKNRTPAIQKMCPRSCLKSLVGLRSSENGEQLMSCDCQGDEQCVRSKSQSQSVCQTEVEQLVAPETQVSCSVATWICMSDQSCLAALDLFYENCRPSLLSQRQCTPQCNNNLGILYKQAKAAKLINCYCDGSEDFPCEKYKTYTERYCQAGRFSNHSARLDEDDDAEELDQNNATIDQDTNEAIPVQQHESEYDLSVSETENETTEGDNNAMFDGKEDNWIPLVSNRFFNNLQAQRKEQQKKAAKTQQRRPTNNKPAKRQKKAQQQQQQQHNRHLRRNRLVAQASTASSSAVDSTTATRFWHLLLPVLFLFANALLH